MGSGSVCSTEVCTQGSLCRVPTAPATGECEAGDSSLGFADRACLGAIHGDFEQPLEQFVTGRQVATRLPQCLETLSLLPAVPLVMPLHATSWDRCRQRKGGWFLFH